MTDLRESAVQLSLFGPVYGRGLPLTRSESESSSHVGQVLSAAGWRDHDLKSLQLCLLCVSHGLPAGEKNRMEVTAAGSGKLLDTEYLRASNRRVGTHLRCRYV